MHSQPGWLYQSEHPEETEKGMKPTNNDVHCTACVWNKNADSLTLWQFATLKWMWIEDRNLNCIACLQDQDSSEQKQKQKALPASAYHQVTPYR